MNDEYRALLEELENIKKDPSAVYDDQDRDEKILSEIVNIERRHIFGSGQASSSKRSRDVEDALRKHIIEG